MIAIIPADIRKIGKSPKPISPRRSAGVCTGSGVGAGVGLSVMITGAGVGTGVITCTGTSTGCGIDANDIHTPTTTPITNA
jgi:hypothetical protein